MLLYQACWAIIRPWLDPVTAAKAQFINLDQIPTIIDRAEVAEEFLHLYAPIDNSSK